MKAKTLQEIANELGLSVRTIQRWCKKENLKLPKGLKNPYWQKVIYEAFWYPDKATEDELKHIVIREG